MTPPWTTDAGDASLPLEGYETVAINGGTGAGEQPSPPEAPVATQEHRKKQQIRRKIPRFLFLATNLATVEVKFYYQK
jgi:hypothetical protein